MKKLRPAILYLGLLVSVLILMIYDEISFIQPSLYNVFIYYALLLAGLLSSVLYALSSASLILAVNKLCQRPFKEFLVKTWVLGATTLVIVMISYFTMGIPFLGIFLIYLVINGIGTLIAHAINPIEEEMPFSKFLVYITNFIKVYSVYANYIKEVEKCVSMRFTNKYSHRKSS